jgi:hypothetical protein
VDDDINEMVVKPLAHGVTLHSLIDACHSGTVLDLPYMAKGQSTVGHWVWEDHRRRVYKGAFHAHLAEGAFCERTFCTAGWSMI